MIAKDSQRDEKVIANGCQANSSTNARLLTQCQDQAIEVLGQGSWQNLRLPDVIFAVDDDCEVAGAYIGHRHLLSWDLEEKWCQTLRLRARRSASYAPEANADWGSARDPRAGTLVLGPSRMVA
jgi:hypothetical protein